MIITKKALPQADISERAQAMLALPLLDAMIPAATAWAQTPAKPVKSSDSSTCRWGATTRDGRRRCGEADPAVADTAVARACQRPAHRHYQHAAAELYPGTHDTSNSGFLSALLEAHRELGLLPRHDDGSDCGEADRPRHAVAVARAGDGFVSDRGRVQQRIRLRLSKLLVVVFPDDSAAIRSASAHRLRTSLWRGRHAADGARRSRRASLLDSFGDESRGSSGAWARRRVRVDQYLDSVRESSGRFSARRPAPWTTRCRISIARSACPPHSPTTRSYVRSADLAFQADITRVITFQLTRELSNRTYPEIGVPDPHHPTSHHGNDPEKVEKIAKINAFHVSLFAEFLEKMKATPDGDGSLLDHPLIPLRQRDGESEPARSREFADPGRRRRRTAEGRQHIKYENGAPLANLHFTLLDRVGVRLDSFADSDGTIARSLRTLSYEDWRSVICVWRKSTDSRS